MKFCKCHFFVVEETQFGIYLIIAYKDITNFSDPEIHYQGHHRGQFFPTNVGTVFEFEFDNHSIHIPYEKFIV